MTEKELCQYCSNKINEILEEEKINPTKGFDGIGIALKLEVYKGLLEKYDKKCEFLIREK